MFRRRLPLSSVVFTVLALASAAVAFGLVRGYEARVEALRPSDGSPVAVLVVADPVERGQPVPADALAVRRIPATFAPPDALSDPAAAVGRIALTDLLAGEVLGRTRLAPSGAGPIAALVPPGLRAAFVAANLPQGSVSEGDRVDVLATYSGHVHTEVVAVGAEVLRSIEPAAPGLGGSDPGAAKLVLLVDPATAEGLATAGAFATLTVTVTGPETAGAATVTAGEVVRDGD